jgi:hypothetical protein
MSYEDPRDSSAAPSIQLPFALLTCAIAVIMISQTVGVFKQRSALKDARVQLTEAIQKRETLVKQSAELQEKLKALVVDLLDLAKTDEDAKAIVSKYNIQQAAPGAGATP